MEGDLRGDSANTSEFRFIPDANDLAIAQIRMRELYDSGWKSRAIGKNVAKEAVDRMASRATEALLDYLSLPWRDANKVQRNQRGYDYLLEDDARIQVKGSMLIEQPGWAHKPDSNHVSLDYDLAIFVHIGPCLDTNWGRFAKYSWPRQSHVDYYLIPNATIRQWVDQPRYLNKGRVEIYWNRRLFPKDSKQHIGQTLELLSFKNRFDLLEFGKQRGAGRPPPPAPLPIVTDETVRG